MAIIRVAVALIVALAFARAEEPPTSHDVKGFIACLDCPRGSDLSGIQVLIKCNKPEKSAVVYTGEDGAFQTKVLSENGPGREDPSKCMAKIIGGPQQLYTKTRDSFLPIGESEGSSSGLTFYKSCPVGTDCGDKEGLRQSKTVDLPLPREWGLAPSSYYVPFFPIIGIP